MAQNAKAAYDMRFEMRKAVFKRDTPVPTYVDGVVVFPIGTAASMAVLFPNGELGVNFVPHAGTDLDGRACVPLTAGWISSEDYFVHRDAIHAWCDNTQAAYRGAYFIAGNLSRGVLLTFHRDGKPPCEGLAAVRYPMSSERSSPILLTRVTRDNLGGSGTCIDAIQAADVAVFGALARLGVFGDRRFLVACRVWPPHLYRLYRGADYATNVCFLRECEADADGGFLPNGKLFVTHLQCAMDALTVVGPGAYARKGGAVTPLLDERKTE